MGGVMTTLIERNTTIPTKRSEVFSTAEDNQPAVDVHVLQGEREMAQYNKTLGKFQLVDLPPARRGVPQIEVSFDIDANGIVHVSATDKGTGKEQSVTITGQSSLSDEDIERMVNDAEAHAVDDKRRRTDAETRNEADSTLYQARRQLDDADDSSAERSTLQAAVDQLAAASEAEDLEAMKSASDDVRSAAEQYTQYLYESAASSDSADGAVEDDDVVDAEIVDDEDVNA